MTPPDRMRVAVARKHKIYDMPTMMLLCSPPPPPPHAVLPTLFPGTQATSNAACVEEAMVS